MKGIKHFLQSAGTYFLGNVLTRLISFFLLPIYTKFLAQADMGYFDVSTSYLNIVVPVVCLEIWSALMRFMFDHEERRGKEKVIFNGLVVFAASIVVYTVGFVALGIITDLKCAILVFFYGIFLMLQNLYSYLARGLGFNQMFALSGILSSFVNSVSNIVMILVFHMRLESLYIAMILGLFVQFCLLEGKVHALKAIRFSDFDWPLIRSMVRFSVPVALNTACYWCLSGYNKIGISNTLGLDASGIYAVAGKFTMMVAIVANCFSLAWQEMVYSLGNEKENKVKLYSTACDLCVTLLVFGTLLIVPAITVIFPFFVDPGYDAAYNVIPLYMFATAISTFASFLGNIFGAEKKTASLFYTTVIAAVGNIALFHLLVGTFGLEAANIGLTFGYVVSIVLRFIELRKLYPVRLTYWRVGLSVLLLVPVFWIYWQRPGFWVSAAVIVAVGLIMLASFHKELKDLWNTLKNRKKGTEE